MSYMTCSEEMVGHIASKLRDYLLAVKLLIY